MQAAEIEKDLIYANVPTGPAIRMAVARAAIPPATGAHDGRPDDAAGLPDPCRPGDRCRSAVPAMLDSSAARRVTLTSEAPAFILFHCKETTVITDKNGVPFLKG